MHKRERMRLRHTIGRRFVKDMHANEKEIEQQLHFLQAVWRVFFSKSSPTKISLPANLIGSDKFSHHTYRKARIHVRSQRLDYSSTLIVKAD